MKKILLFTIALGCASLVNAQKSQPVKKDLTPAKKVTNLIEQTNVNVTAPYKSITSAALIPFTSSLNGYTLLSGKKLTADQQSKTVLYTSRDGGTWGGTGNGIKMKMTTDYGTSSDSVLFANGTSHRYPGGTLFRNGSDLFVVCSGPITSGSGWVSNYVYSSKIDGTLAADTVINYPTTPSIGMWYINESLSALPNGELFLLGEKNGPEPDYNHIDYTIWKMMWNSTDNKFNYTSSYEFTPLLSATMAPVQPYGMAFNDDGSIGYFWFNGEDSITRPNQSTQPLVWKTTNHGTTWTQMTIYDYSQIQEIKDYVWPTKEDTSVVRPVFFYGYTTSDKNLPGIVDAQGNLHLIATIQGGYSSNPDSLGYTYAGEPAKLFDLYTTSAGWDAKYIDTLFSEVDDGTSVTIFGDFAIDHRIHIGKTENGNKIFAMWTDTDPIIGSTTNVYPDFKVWGHDITNGNITGSKNLSLNTPSMGLFLYMNASDIILDDAGAFKIPVVVVNGSDPVNSPINHLYVTGLELTESDFVPNAGVNEVENNIGLVSQNYPNPFNGSTSINVTLSKPSDLSISVINMLGQKIFEINKGNTSAGTHNFTINGSKFTSGIYFYTVKAGNNSVTNKMIVE